MIYEMAATQGYADAQNNLGVMYAEGTDVPQDYIQAHMWFSLSAAQGDESGRINRDMVADDMSPTDISKAQSLAREWLEEHGE